MFAGIYNLGPLDPMVIESLRATFLAEVAAIALPSGDVPCAMNINIATVRLRPETP